MVARCSASRADRVPRGMRGPDEADGGGDHRDDGTYFLATLSSVLAFVVVGFVWDRTKLPMSPPPATTWRPTPAGRQVMSVSSVAFVGLLSIAGLLLSSSVKCAGDVGHEGGAVFSGVHAADEYHENEGSRSVDDCRIVVNSYECAGLVGDRGGGV